MYSMSFTVTVTPDGLYHIQNGVAGLSGQHHVHSAESFKRWQKPGDDIRKAIAEARAEHKNPEILDFSTLDRAHLFGLEIDTGAGWIDV